jgi:hypothetical protein
MENNNNSVAWLQGLSEYFDHSNDIEAKKFIDFLVHMSYAENPVVNMSNSKGMVEFVSSIRKYVPNAVFDIIHKYFREDHNPVALQDAFSRGQVLSKIWMATELAKVKKDFDSVFLLAGWFGQARLFFDLADISYNQMRVIDIDPLACKVSDQIFNIEQLTDYKVKSVELDLTDMSWLYRTGAQYKVKNYTNNTSFDEKMIPDLVINTSAEHFHEDWYHKFVNRPLETDPIFVIQSNNLHEVDDHINSIHSMSEMKKKFPMTRLLYEGVLQLTGYKRFMLIGRP